MTTATTAKGARRDIKRRQASREILECKSYELGDLDEEKQWIISCLPPVDIYFFLDSTPLQAHRQDVRHVGTCAWSMARAGCGDANFFFLFFAFSLSRGVGFPLISFLQLCARCSRDKNVAEKSSETGNSTRAIRKV